MPLVSALAPAWRVAAPATVVHARIVAERLITTRSSMPNEAVASATSVVAHAGRTSISSSIAAGVWLAGGVSSSRGSAAACCARARLVRRATPAGGWKGAVARARVATGIRADVRVTAIAAPAVTGVFGPVVLVPPSSDAWDDDRRHAVLLHELAHVSQRDCALQLVATMACAMHWFNPLVWIAARRLRFERELAADDAVLSSGTLASSYAADLLAIAAAACDDVPATALGMGARSHLATRITAIVAAGARTTLSKRQTCAIVGAGMIVIAGTSELHEHERHLAAAPGSGGSRSRSPPRPRRRRARSAGDRRRTSALGVIADSASQGRGGRDPRSVDRREPRGGPARRRRLMSPGRR